MVSKIIKQSKILRFRQAEKSDLPYIMQVEGVPENAMYVIPYCVEKHEATLDTEDAVHLIVETADGKEKVGFLMIAGLANPFKEIEFTRIIITKKGRGYGQETLKLLKSWAFDDLKFHRAWLDCKEHNARALHVYEKAGFIREGLIRETIIGPEGNYESLVILGILDREYFAAF
jgi:RimJ/RimL family protein N-acetyltransferase